MRSFSCHRCRLTSGEEDTKRLYDVARPHYEAALARFHQKLLFASPWPPSGIWAKRTIATPADIAALKIRTYDATSTDVFIRLGASAFNISFADLVGKLDRHPRRIASQAERGGRRCDRRLGR